ncbi:ff935c0d-015a-40f0-bbfb-5b3a500d5123 [Thermothielavioides terrestris]|uniref:Ff935c0d-015a-40f0-bbfb-5b3a500d5123 n=1 Tax=Thermothielavioides terrestris TaxID=2587410 RepID=A0A3S4AHM3_9PEZI|nr:ff935c0d-015a-40f0-bbfb-5b3a500d5123 [Thermothielavioides terrestris]
MSSFGAKRRGRVIQTFDDESDDLALSSNGGNEEQNDQSAPPGRIKFGRNKSGKPSALRKSLNLGDEDGSLSAPASAPTASARDDDEDDTSSGPVVVRPAPGRSGSTRIKKRPAASRLSFGPSGGEAAEEGEAAAAGEAVIKPSAPRKPLTQRILQNNALRRTGSLQNLTSSLPIRFGGEEDRPKYSKEYLEELQSATPNTPQNLASLQIDDDGEAMELDEAELDGALVVQSTDVAAPAPPGPASTTQILTEAEIRERKERRARLAQEASFIPLEGGSDDEAAGQGGRMTVHFPSTKKKKESRLIAEDEDLGEGYDEFVSDGGLALGRRAERDAARRHRQEMAELIQAAEEGSEAETDDSEAERRAAYEAAQRRAGLDGLHHHHRRLLDDPEADADGAMAPDAIPRMKPLPKLGEVLQRMRDIVQGLEDEVVRKRARIEGLEKEKAEILAREKEVQEILNQAGAKYQAVLANAGGTIVADVNKLAGQSPLRPPLPPGIAGELPVERGLESFGATPTKRDDVDETS